MSLLDEGIFERHTMTWHDFRALLYDKRRIIALVFIATVVGAYLGLQLMTERYEGKAMLLVKLGRENAEVPTTVQNGGFVATGMRKEGINSEVQILTSPSLIEETVDKFGPDTFAFRPAAPQTILQSVRYYFKATIRGVKESGRRLLIALNLKKNLSEHEAAIQMLEDSLQVEPEKDTDVIAVTMKLPDPQLCQAVLNNILQLYLDRHVRAWRSPAAKEFFDKQLEEYRKRLLDLQGEREKVRTKWSLSSTSEQRSLLLRQLNEASGQIAANNAETDSLSRQLSLMASRVENLPERVTSTQVQTQNPSIQSIKDRITSLELEHAKLSSRYLPEAEPVKKVESEIVELQALLQGEKPTLLGSVSSEVNPLRQNFSEGIEQSNIKVGGLQAKNRGLQSTSDQINKRLHALNAGEDQLEAIERDYKIAQDNYFNYAKRGEEGRVSEELDLARVSNVSILSPASVSPEPVYPRKLLIMGVAMGLGLVLGIALAMLLEYMDDTIKKPQDITEVGNLRVLGTFRSRRLDAQKLSA